MHAMVMVMVLNSACTGPLPRYLSIVLRAISLLLDPTTRRASQQGGTASYRTRWHCRALPAVGGVRAGARRARASDVEKGGKR